MTDQQNKPQDQQDQARSHRREQLDQAGTANATENPKTSPTPTSGIDPKSTNPKDQQDPSKKDASRQPGVTDPTNQDEKDQNNRRRAS